MENNLGYSAIGWVHTQLVGGVKQIAITTGAYVAIIVAAAMLMTRLNDHMSLATVMGLETRLLLGLQAAVMLLFGVYRVTASIRIDITTNMIESHRLMPLRPAQAVLGYLVGGTSQALAIFTVNMLLSGVFGRIAGVDLGQLFLGHALMFLLGGFVWTLAALCALAARQVVGLLGLLPMVMMFTQGVALVLLPGLAVLTSPLLGDTVFSLSSSRPITGAHVAAIVAQVAAGAIFFTGAARKYRRPDRPALLPWHGVALVTVWTFVSAIGITYWDDLSIAYRNIDIRDVSVGGRLLASLIATMLLMLLPVASAAWLAADAVRHPEARRRISPALAAAGAIAGCVLLASLLTYVARDRVRQDWTGTVMLPVAMTGHDLARTLMTALIVTAFCLSMYYLLRIVYRAGSQRGGLFAFLWLFGTWVLPLLVDLGRHMLFTPLEDHPLRLISTLSPIGALVTLWVDEWPRVTANGAHSPVAGVAVQVVLAALMVALYQGTGRSRAAAEQPGAAQTATLPESH